MSEAKRELPVINSDAAGIDLGADDHWGGVPADRATPNVRRFGCFTANLYEMAQWLQECGVKTVAMEATGV